MIFSIVALSLGIIGTIILAFSLNDIVKELVNSIKFHDITIKTYLTSRSDVPVFNGIDERLEKGLANSKYYMLLGLIFIGLGYIVQLIYLITS